METPMPATVCSKIVVRTHHSGDKLWVCRVDAASPHGRHAFVQGHSARKFIERSVLVVIMLLHEQLATSLQSTIDKQVEEQQQSQGRATPTALWSV